MSTLKEKNLKYENYQSQLFGQRLSDVETRLFLGHLGSPNRNFLCYFATKIKLQFQLSFYIFFGYYVGWLNCISVILFSVNLYIG